MDFSGALTPLQGVASIVGLTPREHQSCSVKPIVRVTFY
jgi:hypothetical protein